MDDIRECVVAQAREWIGTPFGHQGRLPGVRLDCIGLVICACWELGIKPRSFNFKAYPGVPDGHSLIAAADEHMTRIRPADMQPGDVAVFHFGRHPQHLGIVGDYLHGGLSLIHAAQQEGRVIEHHLDPSHMKRLVGAYRLPGVDA